MLEQTASLMVDNQFWDLRAHKRRELIKSNSAGWAKLLPPCLTTVTS
jgi:hypothetical protein